MLTGAAALLRGAASASAASAKVTSAFSWPPLMEGSWFCGGFACHFDDLPRIRSRATDGPQRAALLLQAQRQRGVAKFGLAQTLYFSILCNTKREPSHAGPSSGIGRHFGDPGPDGPRHPVSWLRT